METTKEENAKALLHYNMAFIGGFLGMYAVLARSGFLGSAQTANLIYIVIAIVGKNPLDLLLRVGAMALYSLAVAFTTALPHHFKNINLKLISIFVDLGAIAILGFIPKDANLVLGLYPIFFAMAFQWCSFTGAYGFTCSSIFSTNNLRQFSAAMTEIYINKDKSFKLKAKFYGITLVSFHIGALISCVLWQALGIKAVWLCALPAIPAIFMAAKTFSLKAVKGSNSLTVGH